MPKTPKPPPTFDNEELSENKVVKTWKERGFEDMALLTLSQKFLAAYRKDKSTKDKQAAKAAKKAKLPIPEPGPEMPNPKIDEPCFTKLITKGMKIEVADSKGLFKAANTSRSGLVSFGEFVKLMGTLKNKDTAPEAQQEKLALAFRMYDRDQSGTLELEEVQTMLETGLASVPTTKGDLEAKQRQVEHIMKQVESTTNTGSRWRPKKVTQPVLRQALRSEQYYQELPEGSGVEVGGITENQLFETTVLKSSRLCVIL